MLRKPLIIGLCLVVIAAGVFYFAFSTLLNKGVKKAVETYGPELTKTEIRLDAVNLSPFNGAGVLQGLYVGNPEGFKSDKAFSVGEIEIDLEPFSVFSDHIVVHKIRIVRPQVVYEKNSSGDNLNAILANVEESISAVTGMMQGDAGDEPIRFEIKDLRIEGGTITVGLLGRGLTVPMRDIHLQNLGSDSGGITSDELLSEIMRVVVGQVLESVGDVAGAIAEDGVRAVEGAVGSVSEGAKEVIGGLKRLMKKKRE